MINTKYSKFFLIYAYFISFHTSTYAQFDREFTKLSNTRILEACFTDQELEAFLMLTDTMRHTLFAFVLPLSSYAYGMDFAIVQRKCKSSFERITSVSSEQAVSESDEESTRFDRHEYELGYRTNNQCAVRLGDVELQVARDLDFAETELKAPKVKVTTSAAHALTNYQYKHSSVSVASPNEMEWFKQVYAKSMQSAEHLICDLDAGKKTPRNALIERVLKAIDYELYYARGNKAVESSLTKYANEVRKKQGITIVGPPGPIDRLMERISEKKGGARNVTVGNVDLSHDPYEPHTSEPFSQV